MHPVHQWAEMREQLRLNKIYQGLRCDSRPRYVFHGKDQDFYRLEHPHRKTIALFPPLSGNRRNGIKIPGLKTLYRPIMGASPATYFVKNGGSDAADGLSDENAWETLDKVNASSFSGDDIIQFKQGDTWVDRLNVPSSGSEGSVITFQSYGSGARPLFYGLTTISTFVLHSGNIYKKTDATANAQLYRHVFEDGLRLIYRGSLGTMVQGSFFHDDAADTLYIWSTDDADPDTHTIERCQDWIGFDANGKEYFDIDGIECKGYATRGFDFTSVEGANNINLTDCVASWNCATGFSQSGYVSTLGSNIVYDSCIGHDNLGENFWIGNGSDHEMKNCTSYNSGKDKILKDYDQGPLSHMAGGLVVGIQSTDVIVENNTFYDNYRHPSLRVEFEVGYDRPTGTIVRYNLFDSSLGAVGEHGSCFIEEATNSEVYYNLMLGDASDATLRIQDDASNCEYYNNTIYHIDGIAAVWIEPATNITFKNNIIYSEADDAVIRVPPDGQSGFTSDYNCMYHEGAANGAWIWNYNRYDTLALWIAQSGTDGNSIQSDPLFISGAGSRTDDYSLQSGSPCIEAGIEISGLIKDYGGIPLGRGTNPDIGAHETLKGGPRRL